MKNRSLILTLAAMIMLSSCGNNVPFDDSSKTETSIASQTDASQTSTTTSASSRTTSLPQTKKTEAVTTTAEKKEPAQYTAEKDTTKPYVLNNGTYYPYLQVGKPFDINDFIGYGDDTDRHPKLTYTGKVNNKKVGDYPLKLTVTDASGNSVSWDLTIHVVNKLPTPKYLSFPNITFSQFKQKYKGENTRFGIDVSQWQGYINFKAVKNAGCSFVFIRVGSKLGGYTLDPYFKTNLNNALAAGLDVGVYLYTNDHTNEGARSSARWVISQLGGKKLTMPVVCDWEETADFQRLGASFKDINNAYKAFKDELSKSGYSSMVYGNPTTLANMWDQKTNNSNPIWLAHYVGKTNYSGNYSIWQVCYGKIPGISAVTDFNVLYTNKRYK